ncbi:Zinc carboxypeptidase [Posidoniimonas polymericola]|uniref:Zinc carboxypeptidase n=1 Tax=Posidoniimonas polymericola TaxID=2528002 RepID=A0A5C5YTV7_9BACT|nr:M14 family zinc carboxypeptidase [Posidoniimonas polymericola]TWT78444.1 Zinc carboxypeptidase [Posidoniimonas polymericola]
MPKAAATCPLDGWTHESVTHYIDSLFDEHPGSAERSVIGSSYEGRPIEMIKLGAGPRRVLAWAQMHGDEQTYTTAVLNTLRVLMDDPESPRAAAVLSGATLMLIPLLNPDGAARRTRINAQGVDINRDARAPDTPEGRVLRQAVLELRPDFGFNLHNQDHRRWLRSGEGPVSVSLLVPPPDESNSQTPSVVAARRVAASITQHVKPLCDGRVTRYGASYMPRAFGEWVQSQGVATVLLEAGGWPGGDLAALENANFEAFFTGLEAIATEAYRGTPPDEYDHLQRASGHESFDLLIHRARVIQHTGGSGSLLDLGINNRANSAMPTRLGEARIDDIGDLSVHPRDAWIDATGQLCLPGRVALVDTPLTEQGVAPELLEQAARVGVTTLLVGVDGTSEQLALLGKIVDGPRPLINVGFLLRPEAAGALHDAPDCVLGVAAGPAASGVLAAATIGDWRQGANLLGQCVDASALEIARGSLADLVLAAPAAHGGPLDSISRVLIGGTTVLQEGRIVEPAAGHWLKRRCGLNRG